jgi:hypothetical protein
VAFFAFFRLAKYTLDKLGKCQYMKFSAEKNKEGGGGEREMLHHLKSENY